MCLCHPRHKAAIILIFRVRLKLMSKCHVLYFDLSALITKTLSQKDRMRGSDKLYNDHPSCWLEEYDRSPRKEECERWAHCFSYTSLLWWGRLFRKSWKRDMNRIDETRSMLNLNSTISFWSKSRILFISLPDFYL